MPGGLTHIAEWERMDHAFLAPELVAYNPRNPGLTIPSTETDMYAFALVVWHVYTNRVPVASEYTDKRVPIRKLVQRSVRPTRPIDVIIPDLLWDTMVIGWGQDRNARPTTEQWLKALHKIEPKPKFVKEQDVMEQGSQANVQPRPKVFARFAYGKRPSSRPFSLFPLLVLALFKCSCSMIHHIYIYEKKQ
jgi:hypothetical protein